jgi:hypothetical protein
MASKPFLPAREDRQEGTRGDTLSLVSKTVTRQKLTLEILHGQKSSTEEIVTSFDITFDITGQIVTSFDNNQKENLQSAPKSC